MSRLRRPSIGLQQNEGAWQRRLVNFARAFRVAVGDLELSVDLAPGEGDTGHLEQDLPRLLVAMAEVAADRHTAIGLFIDEVQYLSSSELAAVIVACHEIAQRNLPFLFVGAGLPQVAALAGKAKSYAERLFDYPQVGPLECSDARLALVKPAWAEGVSFDGDAVDEILTVAQNFPDHLYGDETVRRRNEWPSAVHPVVRTHPETGRKALFVNSIFTRRILGVTESESRALLEFLFEHVTNPHFQCRFRWRPNSIAFWDNRCVQHHAMWDYFPRTRSGTRVTVAGDRPYH